MIFAGARRNVSAAAGVLTRTLIRIVNHDLNRSAFGKASDRFPGLHRFNLGDEVFFFPLDPVDALLEGELRPPDGLPDALLF